MNNPPTRLALIGHPNVGKSTLFNQLTGQSAKIGNWAGVTVSTREAPLKESTGWALIDCPGVYTLTVTTADQQAKDEAVTAEVLSQGVDCVVNVIDAPQLARQLYVTLQLRERGLPMVVVLNRIDTLPAGMHIDVPALETALGCPVYALSANKADSVQPLLKALTRPLPTLPRFSVDYPKIIRDSLRSCEQVLEGEGYDRAAALPWLEGDQLALPKKSINLLGTRRHIEAQVVAASGQSPDIVMAMSRYQWIDSVVERVQQAESKAAPMTWTQTVDQWVLHRVIGFPIFLLVIYSLFFFAIQVGGAFQPFVELTARALFVDGLASGLNHWQVPPILVALLSQGIGVGIATTLTFIPVIGAMFFGLNLLEQCGYMPRAAFVMDKLMRAIGLPGKSFVPMIIGFGCNVPAVMAARTLEERRDRVLTVMMMPFMSCGARLAIYAVFVAAFFPEGGANVVFGLYLLGIAMAVLTGILLKKTYLQGKPSPLILELPPYQLPTPWVLARQVWHRLKGFLKRAGRIIIPVCVIIGTLNAVGIDGSVRLDRPHPESLLATSAQWITPVFSPMGIREDNWPATVGLATGILAKEVVVGALNALYLPEEINPEEAPFNLTVALQEAWSTLREEWVGLSRSWSHPLERQWSETVEDNRIFGEMWNRFGGTEAAIAYLIFILLYIPCVSTVAAMVREVGRRWAVFSLFWTTYVAYATAVIVYQALTFSAHPVPSLAWVGCFVIATPCLFQLVRPKPSRYKPLPTRLKLVVNSSL